MIPLNKHLSNEWAFVKNLIYLNELILRTNKNIWALFSHCNKKVKVLIGHFTVLFTKKVKVASDCYNL